MYFVYLAAVVYESVICQFLDQILIHRQLINFRISELLCQAKCFIRQGYCLLNCSVFIPADYMEA